MAAETGDREHFNRCFRAVDRMDRLVDDLLTLARQGRIDELERVDLAAVAARCRETVATGDAEIRIETDRTVLADEGRLRQLLENLFRNAVEHGAEDPATAQAADGTDEPGAADRGSRTRDDGDLTVTVGEMAAGFYVEDDGAGIPEPARDDVFENGYSTAQEGTGFGLAIVEGIASAHGWEVAVTDGSDGGARFEITVEEGEGRHDTATAVDGERGADAESDAGPGPDHGADWGPSGDGT